MLMLLVLSPDNSFMVLVLCTITYRLENKHRDTADLTASVWAEPAANLHGVHVSLEFQLRCTANKKQFSGHGPLKTWPYLSQPPSYLCFLPAKHWFWVQFSSVSIKPKSNIVVSGQKSSLHPFTFLYRTAKHFKQPEIQNALN